MSPEEKFAADKAKVEAEYTLARGWVEKHLNWIIAVACLVLGAIVGHLIK